MQRRFGRGGALLLAVFILLFCWRFLLHAGSSKENLKPSAPVSADYFPGRLLIKLKAVTKKSLTAQTSALLDAYPINDLRPLFPEDHSQYTAAHSQAGLSRLMLATVSSQSDIPALAARLQQDPLVEYAEPDHLLPLAALPNDSLFAQQQHLLQIKAPPAWEIAHGDSQVVIAIIDSGTDWQHPDLAANIWSNPNEVIDGRDNDNNGFIDDVRGWDFVDQVPNPYPGEDAATPDNDPMDFAGHGTGVAGVAAAVTDNSLGIAALSWNVKIMPLRVGWLRIDGVSLVDVAWTAAAFVYAADNGAQVANLSAGSSRVVAEAAAYAFSKGVVITSAAGNSSSADAFGLNLAPFAITVAAVDDQDQYAPYTSYGDWIKVSAPGGELKHRQRGILTTFLQHGYAELQGTSFASPLAAALAALVKSQHPDWTPAQITFQVVETADNIDALNPDYLWGKLGRGRINAERALTETVTAAPQISLVGEHWDDRPGNGNDNWDPGETIQLALTLRNDWGDANNLRAEIFCDDYAVRLSKGSSNYGTLRGLTDLSACERDNHDDPFLLTAIPEAVPHRVRFKLRVYAEGGYEKYFDFYLTLTPTLLLVDDDDGKNNVENYYTEVLDSIGISFETFTHANHQIDPAVLHKYATVIWACEWAFPSVDANDRAALQNYLAGGGNLFISGQDIGWDLCDPATGVANEFNLSGGSSKVFYEQFLHARYLRDDANTSQVFGVAGDPISDSLQFNIQQPGRTVSEQLPSEIFPLAPATAVFRYPSGQAAGVRYAGDYRLVYFAFGGYEAIVQKTERDAIMPRLLNWLNGLHFEHSPLRDTDDTTHARAVTVKIASEISPPERVELYWDVDGQLPFHKVTMAKAGNGEYRAEIPPQFRKTVEYFFYVMTQRGFAPPLQRFSYATFPDTLPPVLEELPQLPNTLNNFGPYVVTAVAHDPSGLDTSTFSLFYRSTSGKQGERPMRRGAEGAPDTFVAAIGGEFDYGDSIFYHVLATDLALARNQTSTPEKFFIVGLNDFETGGLYEWQTDSSGWGATRLRAYAGRYGAHSNPGRVYPLQYNAVLASTVPVHLTHGAVKLEFFEQHYFEENQEDFGVVEIAYDAQPSLWTPLSEAFRGVQSQWQKREYLIPPLPVTGSAWFRFRVQTDDQPNSPRPGWFIDEVRLIPADMSAVDNQSAAASPPLVFALSQSYPNPLSGKSAPTTLTSIRFDLPEPAEVNLSIYDLLGRHVATLVNARQQAGSHLAQWSGVDENGRGVAAGVYLYRLRAVSSSNGKNFQAVRKMIVMP